MYPYHNKIKQRINNGELIFIEKTKGKFAVIFHFKTFPFTRPIREKSLYRYSDILENKKYNTVDNKYKKK